MTGETAAAGEDDLELVARALLASLPADRITVLVGNGELAAVLRERAPERFVGTDTLARGIEREAGILALSLDEGPACEAGAIARELGLATVQVLVLRRQGAALRLAEAASALHLAGLVFAEARRLAWTADDGASGSRRGRIDAECAAHLLTAVLGDHPEAPRILEDTVVRVSEELDVYAEAAVAHAATREVERARERRLEELEGQLGRLGGAHLAGEVEALRGEIAAIKATRVWRVGTSWWRLRDRLRGRGPAA